MTHISTADDLPTLKHLMACEVLPDEPHPDLNVVFLIAGAVGSMAEAVYDAAVDLMGGFPERHAVLLTDLSLLEQARREAWFGEQLDRYAVYRVADASFARSQGPIDELLLPDQSGPDAFLIDEAYDDQTEGSACA